MRCAIMQPTYLPWAGYFNLMACVDVFVFLDDAQLQKNSWHNRNRLLINQRPHWITVPVIHNKLTQLLSETTTCEEKKWRRKHANMLQQSYSRHPHKSDIISIIDFLMDDDTKCLAQLNVGLIRLIANKLGLSTTLQLSSEMSIAGSRTERILNILEAIEATEYLSPVGSTTYLEEDRFSLKTSINLQFQAFTPQPYPQYGQGQFIPYMSIVDVVANLGWHATSRYILNSI